VDADGSADLDPGRVYYFGQSFGGFLGSLLLATEPGISAGVLNVAGGPVIETARLSPALRGFVVVPDVASRNLLNLPPLDVPGVGLVPQFNENLPLRNQPPVINDVPGAIEIQQFFDRREWATYVASPLSFAPHIRKDPLAGNAPKSVIIQFAKGDQTVPNPTNSALIRAGDFLDRTSYYRADLAVAANPLTPRNPHTFLTGIVAPGLAPVVALQAQTQIASFFASDGRSVIDPDGAGPLFEVPIAGALPEGTNFIP
jgi:pimeloyl-ACP methyl ester carboxylesterase